MVEKTVTDRTFARSGKQLTQSRETAEEIAVAMLAWLAAEPEQMGRFLALSGLQADQLRSAAGDPGFLAGVIDFVMGHEPTLMAFCATTAAKPEAVAAAAYVLSGRAPGPGEY